MVTTTQELEQPNRSKDEFLAKLPSADREKLKKIIELFEGTMTEMGKNGALVVVGGVLTKPLPRPDIDLLIILENDPSDPIEANFENHYLYALEDFKIFKKIIEGMSKKNPGFSISKIQEPAIDIEFQSPSILCHEGSVSIADNNSTPMELIRINTRGNFQEVMKPSIHNETRPYILLSEAKGNPT